MAVTGQVTTKPPLSICFDPALALRAQDEPTLRLRLTTASPDRIQTGERTLNSESPSADHWLGTDLSGRDVYSRIIHGSRLALIIGLGASLVATAFGTIGGVVAPISGA